VTGAFDGGRDEYWFRRNLPGDGSVQFENRTSALTTIGVWGPDAAAMMASVTDADLSAEAFPYGTTREVLIDGIPCRMFRISYVGENGWEVYTAMEHGLRLWDTLWQAGQPFDVRPVGIGVYGTTGRLEKGYRLMGAELESEYSPVEAGLARRKVKAADFIGKEAYLAERDAEPVTVLCTLTMDDHTSASGEARFPTGGNEPILTAAGERIVDAKGRVSRVTSAGAGPSLGAYLLMAYLPPEHAVEGTSLQVMYMNEKYPVTVARVGSKPLFDPDDDRMKS
jgi:glycine cleavage system aminomethyltransferase T